MRPIGTPREIADKNIARFHAVIFRLESEGKATAVAEMQRDKWLEYRHSCRTDGTLDEMQYL